MMSRARINPYLDNNEVFKWKDIITSKNIILDNDAIVAILSFKADGLLNEMIELHASLSIINPVSIELLNTKSQQERTMRQLLLEKYEIKELQLFGDKEFMQNISKVMLYLKDHSRFPSPTDIYLASTIVKYSNNQNTYLLTANTSDFPLPLFKREAFLVLQNKLTYKALAFISADIEVFKTISQI